MKTSTKWIIGVVAVLMVATLGVAAMAASLFTVSRSESGSGGDPEPQPVPTTVAAPIEDGSWFGFVTIVGDRTNPPLTVDLADLLTGKEAHDAAVKAGVISEDEELPNDMYIVNDKTENVDIEVAADADIEVLSADHPGESLSIGLADLSALYHGTYSGPAVYGIVDGQPIAMQLTVKDGKVIAATAVYLP